MLPKKEDGLATFSRVGLILGKVMMTLRKFYYVQTHQQQQKGQIDWPVCFSVHVCPVFSPWVLMWIPNHIKPAFSKVLFKKDNMSLLKVHPGNTGYWLVLRAENLYDSSCTRKRCFMCVTAMNESFLGHDPAQTEAERCNSDQGLSPLGLRDSRRHFFLLLLLSVGTGVLDISGHGVCQW